MKKNYRKNYKYTCFVRSTSNTMSKKDMYQVSLPPHVWKKMKWKINEKVFLYVIRDEETKHIIIKNKEK